jgi:hypothetical protein
MNFQERRVECVFVSLTFVAAGLARCDGAGYG